MNDMQRIKIAHVMDSLKATTQSIKSAVPPMKAVSSSTAELLESWQTELQKDVQRLSEVLNDRE